MPGRRTGGAAAWRNWAGTQRCTPRRIVRPTGEDEVSHVVAEAARRGDRVRVVGAGHSFADVVPTDGVLLDLSALDRLLALDLDSGRVTVQAGMPLWRLNAALATHGRALVNLGDIAVQSVAGAVSTATHGTGAHFGNLATQVHALRLVDGSGEVVDAEPGSAPDLAGAAKVSVGALGVITRVTLDTVPAFRLHAVEEPRRLHDVLDRLDHLVGGNDHFEFFWFPGSDTVLTKRNRRTDEPASPRGRVATFLGDEVVANAALGGLLRLSDLRAGAARTVGRVAARLPRSEYVDRSDRVFASHRRFRFVEMEYAVPRERFPAVFGEVRARLDRSSLPQPVPVECRWVAGDDLPLSPAHERDTAYLAIHLSPRQPWEDFFREVEPAFDAVGGRPHWGKVHFQTAASLAPRYPRWHTFQAVRRKLDPLGRFTNDYVARVLGPVEGAAW